MTQYDFRKMVEKEMINSNIMEAGKFILELVKFETISKTEIDFLFECLAKKGCNYHNALFCLYVCHNELIGNCEKHKHEIAKVAKKEIKMFKEEIEIARMNLLMESEMLKRDENVQKVKGNRKAFFALPSKQQKEYIKKFNNLAELMVGYKSKLLHFAIACHGGTVIQDYEDGKISRKQYVSEVNEFARYIPEICEKYDLKGPAEITINRTDMQEF